MTAAPPPQDAPHPEATLDEPPVVPEMTQAELEAEVDRAHAAGDTGRSAATAADGGDGGEGAADDDAAGVTERFTIGEDLFNGLRAMGFSENAIKKSIASGCINEDTCVQWITMHAGHAELDTPLDPHIRVTVRAKHVLTDEERAAKVAELKQKIQLKKEQDALAARENAVKAERARIAMGKNAHEVREQIEERQRKQAAEERRREKAADAIAREKIQLELAVDRLVRQGRTPDEARAMAMAQLEERKRQAEEERRRRAEEQLAERRSEEAPSRAAGGSASGSGSGSGGGWNLAAVLGAEQVTAGSSFSATVAAPRRHSAAEAPGSAAPGASIVPTGVDELGASDASLGEPTLEGFCAMRERMETHEVTTRDADGRARCLTAISTLASIIRAIIENPLDSRKRHLRVGNATIQQRILAVPHAAQFLRLAGFSVGSAPGGDATAATQPHLIMNVALIRHLRCALQALE